VDTGRRVTTLKVTGHTRDMENPTGIFHTVPRHTGLTLKTAGCLVTGKVTDNVDTGYLVTGVDKYSVK